MHAALSTPFRNKIQLSLFWTLKMWDLNVFDPEMDQTKVF